MEATPKPGVPDIDIYVPGRSRAEGAARVFKLSSNESPFGPGAGALAAYEQAKDLLGVYPEGTAQILRDAIASHFGLASDRIVCGNGSDEILTLIANCYVRADDEVLFAAHTFSLYRIATLANSGIPVEVPAPELRFDVDAAIARINDKTRLVYLANPNNPTGDYVSNAELGRLHKAMPDSAILVIDAAYAEYVRRDDFDGGLALAAGSANVVMTRTFSKVYGLAGIRAGWGFCPQAIAGYVNRIRAPFNVNIVAQKVAVAALTDRAHIETSLAHNELWRARLTGEIRDAGFRVDDSVANFVLIHFPGGPGRSSIDADRFLMRRGIILRNCASYGLPHCLRLTVGSEEANLAAIAALRDFAKST
jgi:histidinol-phosphate aminotransferase